MGGTLKAVVPLVSNIGRDVLGAWAFLAYAVSHLRALSIGPVRIVFNRQLYFTGIQGIGLVLLLGLMVGALVVTQTTAIVGGDSELTVRMLDWTVIGELGPLLAAIIIVARSSVAISTELALMSARGETDHLEMLRIPALDYLVVPRMAALTLSLVVLTVYFQAIAVAGGLAASALYQNLSFATQLARFVEIISVANIAVALLKSVAFGLAISAVSCWHGMGVARTLTAVPIAAMNAVIQSLFAVFAIDAAFAYLRYALL
jgi:phospholipid/cholesterol/gamma-HCH transport system permease protein